jgi:hypothetical protein
VPRIRSVKPEVATHEGLYDLERETGLPIRFAWVILWTACDREGRFRWQPRRLKADILPYDEVAFGAVLEAFERAGFVRRYETDGEVYGYIPTWHQHQAVNHREQPSKIPPPPANPSQQCPGTPGHTQDISTPQATLPEIVDRTSTPGMPAHTQGEGERELERDREGERGEGLAASERPGPLALVASPPSSEFELSPGQIRAAGPGLVEAWNTIVASRAEFAGKAATVRGDHPKVYSALREHPAIDWWSDLFRRVVASDVLSGRKPWRDGDLKAVDLFWVLRNADPVAAGAYDNHPTVGRGRSMTVNQASAAAAKRLLG